MKLKDILTDSGAYGDTEITSLAFDSRKVKKGSLFFCLEGSREDGHAYADDAVLAGAAALVVTHKLKANVPQLVTDDTRTAMAHASVAFYGNPAARMRMVGVTGTNGKTTTTYILKSILEEAGEKVGVIGTNAVVCDGRETPAAMTTPDPIELNATLRRMADCGTETVVMEVSAHALALRKIDGIVFDAAGFTNLSRDHLDFFGSMEHYAAAKKKFFTPEYCRYAVINVDDELGRKIAADCAVPAYTYGCLNPADAFAVNLTMGVGGLEYLLNLDDDLATVKFSLPGRFNMYNTLCAAAIAKVLGVRIRDIANGIKKVRKVEGRFNIVNTARGSVIIDFAHTDDGLKNVLTTIREFAPGRIITVFGCGGNRDKTKRPVMGKIVSDLSDYCIVTSDNPRLEAPEAIISDILRGIPAEKKSRCYTEPDRKKAILKALKLAAVGDIVLIAGKGAEKFQDVGGVKLPYNDEQYVLSLIEENDVC